MLTRATDWFPWLNPIGGRPEGLGSITESMERVREKNTHISPFTGEREGGSEIFLPQSKLVNSEIDWSHSEIFSHQSALMFAPDSAAPSFMIYQPSIWLRIMVPSHECSRKDT